MNWLFEAHSLWRDTLLSLDTDQRALVLPQSRMGQTLLIPHGKPYPLWGVDGGRDGGGGNRRRGVSGNLDWDVK